MKIGHLADFICPSWFWVKLPLSLLVNISNLDSSSSSVPQVLVRWPIQIEELRSDFGDDSLLDTTGHYWTLLDTAGHYRTLLDTTGHYWTLLDTIGHFRTLLDTTGHHQLTTGEHFLSFPHRIQLAGFRNGDVP